MAGNPFCSITLSPIICSTIYPSSWIIDSGASNHIICTPTLYTSISSSSTSFVTLPDGSTTTVTHVGIVQLTSTIILHNVLCVPNFRFKLISVSHLTTTSHFKFFFDEKYCYIQDPISSIQIGKGECYNGLYIFHQSSSVNLVSVPSDVWHKRLGHTSPDCARIIHNQASFIPVDQSIYDVHEPNCIANHILLLLLLLPQSLLMLYIVIFGDQCL